MQVHFFATFRPVVGGKSLEVPLDDGATIDELIDWLVEHHPPLRDELRDEQGGLARRTHIFIDGRGARWLEQGLATPLHANQRIDIFPAVAGG